MVLNHKNRTCHQKILPKRKSASVLSASDPKPKKCHREGDNCRGTPRLGSTRGESASHFGSVCIRLAHTSCKNLVKGMLYSNFDNRALRYC
ncbi:hypothetical protein JTE90_006630 [Oedothorax gibbosus]|uniref:Uncharacterized protein n=1 Tax=Oedothorax gibbosus TaxID=931172 RepID=A0AAV6U6Z1_9ARAC|nr:hypothetical protein JTE90_006630 [Oedothorax gibbosus]